MTLTNAEIEHYGLVAKAIRFLQVRRAASLGELAAHVGMSEAHFQRLFVQWAGVSPKEFVQVLSAQEARKRLLAGESVLETAAEIGLSGASRLHDLMITTEGVSPGELRGNVAVQYAISPTPFGEALFAKTGRGLARIAFVGERDPLEDLASDFPHAEISRNVDALGMEIEEITSRMLGRGPRQTIGIAMTGSRFRLQVWRALMQIPTGGLVSYSGLARAVGRPTASRAVATAVAQNELAFLIPCHRVIRESGEIGGYRWTPERKQLMIVREQQAG